MTLTRKPATLIKIDNRLSPSYYETPDGRTHVYRHGRRWIVARVKDGIAWASHEYRTLRAAKAGV
jgi:hypothetical protein